MSRVFLTAEWRSLVMLNYEVDPAVLAARVPPGTELDEYRGRVFVSMVGFRFLRTRVYGLALPWHVNFDEVNLRFYVRRLVAGEEGWRRGAVFIREIVPRRLIATVARLIYNEPYDTGPVRHRLETLPEKVSARYEWRHGGRWHAMGATAAGGEARDIAAGSETEFITEHYWGYNKQRNGGTMEFAVEHPRWQAWAAAESEFDCNVAAMYGAEFAPFLRGVPSSAFIVEGSAVRVREGKRMMDDKGGR